MWLAHIKQGQGLRVLYESWFILYLSAQLCVLLPESEMLFFPLHEKWIPKCPSKLRCKVINSSCLAWPLQLNLTLDSLHMPLIGLRMLYLIICHLSISLGDGRNLNCAFKYFLLWIFHLFTCLTPTYRACILIRNWEQVYPTMRMEKQSSPVKDMGCFFFSKVQ